MQASTPDYFAVKKGKKRTDEKEGKNLNLKETTWLGHLALLGKLERNGEAGWHDKKNENQAQQTASAAIINNGQTTDDGIQHRAQQPHWVSIGSSTIRCILCTYMILSLLL